MWILEINGRYYGRIIRGLAFRNASVAFAQVLPFRLMLQLGGNSEIYIGHHSLMELESLENSPELKSPATTWYNLSKDGCYICHEVVSICHLFN